MKNLRIRNLLYIFALILSLTGCEALGAEGGVSLGIILGVLGAIVLGWLAFKFLGGILKIGIWGVVILVLLVIGFIAWIIFASMGT